jgi:formylglycine-generating enzyme required for sulfatase activity
MLEGIFMRKFLFCIFSIVIGTGLFAQQPTAENTGTYPSNMVRVEGGAFQMGTVKGGGDAERPVHTVTLSTFYMSQYTVTQKEWYEVMGTTIEQQRTYAKRLSLRGDGDNYPMYFVSWYDAIEYCNKRSLMEGLKPTYRVSGNSITCDWEADGYRLSTEAEWEYAAKGGNGFFGYEYSGSNNVNTVAWYDKNSKKSTQPVGTKTPNNLGLYDMSGNVWEWCWDWYGKYPKDAQTDPKGETSEFGGRVRRGGSWTDAARFVRSAYRGSYSPSSADSDVGFRVVRP